MGKKFSVTTWNGEKILLIKKCLINRELGVEAEECVGLEIADDLFLDAAETK